MPQRPMVLASINLKTTFSIKRPMRIIESNPAKTSGMLSRFFASNMYQPNPPCPDVVPKTSSEHEEESSSWLFVRLQRSVG